MTHVVLTILLKWHLAIVPLFYPKVSGLHNATQSVSYAPRWKHIYKTQNLQEPDGGMLIFKHTFDEFQ
jgi:hypothetical protein